MNDSTSLGIILETRLDALKAQNNVRLRYTYAHKVRIFFYSSGPTSPVDKRGRGMLCSSDDRQGGRHLQAGESRDTPSRADNSTYLLFNW